MVPPMPVCSYLFTRKEKKNSQQIFNRMREEMPQLLEKVHPIRADYSAIDLDIDSADRAMLSSEVQVSKFC